MQQPEVARQAGVIKQTTRPASRAGLRVWEGGRPRSRGLLRGRLSALLSHLEPRGKGEGSTLALRLVCLLCQFEQYAN